MTRMPWRESLQPAVMRRVALASHEAALRDVLALVADDGSVQLDDVVTDPGAPPATPAAARLGALPGGERSDSRVARRAPDLDRCERLGRLDLIAGEAELERRAAGALTRDRVCALVGWMPEDRITPLA